MAGKLTVALSQSQGKNPAKRALEEEVAAALLMEDGVDLALVPHLTDMPADHPGLLHLRGVGGDLVVLGWLYPRASRRRVPAASRRAPSACRTAAFTR